MKNKNFTEEEILEKFEIDTSKIDARSIDEITSEEKKVGRKSESLDVSKFRRFINQVKLAFGLIKDFKEKRYTDIPWRSITLISAAIIYFLNPFDVVPDLFPVIGIADDAVLFATLFKSIQTDLEKYGEWKGINIGEYFVK